ncbi:MAG: zinc ribbon domain-containing protein [Actinomycetota bacterium]|nr:zinc ribbon domain-containing protein [Actinomycetota bacterium]
MPLYEYICLACEQTFEARREVDGPNPRCPECRDERVRRKFSVFATRSEASSSGGCACGGACACGG